MQLWDELEGSYSPLADDTIAMIQRSAETVLDVADAKVGVEDEDDLDSVFEGADSCMEAYLNLQESMRKSKRDFKKLSENLPPLPSPLPSFPDKIGPNDHSLPSSISLPRAVSETAVGFESGNLIQIEITNDDGDSTLLRRSSTEGSRSDEDPDGPRRADSTNSSNSLPRSPSAVTRSIDTIHESEPSDPSFNRSAIPPTSQIEFDETSSPVDGISHAGGGYGGGGNFNSELTTNDWEQIRSHFGKGVEKLEINLDDLLNSITCETGASLASDQEEIGVGAPAIDRANIEHGRIGEFIAERLLAQRFPNTRVEWMNRDSESALPYDFVVGDSARSASTSALRYVEVKTRVTSDLVPVSQWFISRNEIYYAYDQALSRTSSKYSCMLIHLSESNGTHKKFTKSAIFWVDDLMIAANIDGEAGVKFIVQVNSL